MQGLKLCVCLNNKLRKKTLLKLMDTDMVTMYAICYGFRKYI
jgi:hypothetical protein